MHCEGFRPVPGKCGEPLTSSAVENTIRPLIILMTIVGMFVIKLN